MSNKRLLWKKYAEYAIIKNIKEWETELVLYWPGLTCGRGKQVMA